jgi:ribose transport system ATP-binding protein
VSLDLTGSAPLSGGDALTIRHLSKRFGGAVALDDVSLSVASGEVHGLLGSNGSGKSTLIKVLAGFHDPEPGADIRLFGQPVPLPVNGQQIHDMGLAFVHQHLGLIPALSVTENLYLSEFSTAENWAINWRACHDMAAEIFARFDLKIDPRAETGSLSAVEQALLAIVRAYEELQNTSAAQGVLILDEPTPFLPRAGVEQLFQLMRSCTAAGASVIFVSHDVDEVREITDRATILRDGKLIETVETARTSHAGFVSRIIGRQLERYGGAAKTVPSAAPSVRGEGLSAPGLGPVSFEAAPGEILGLTGLIGSGFDQCLGHLYGASESDAGTLQVDGRALDLTQHDPIASMAHAIAYLPADRLGRAGVGSLSIADNIAMPVYEDLGPRGVLTDATILRHAAQHTSAAGVKPNAPELPLAALSGGNAQKVVLAKWLQTAPRLLLLDEPTQGVDVGARQAIWDQLDQAASSGSSVLVASSDYDQLAQICHRVLIFARGQIVASLTGAQLTKETIAERCYHSLAGQG